MNYYDRRGEPLADLWAWVKLYEGDPLYKIVARSTVTDLADPASAVDVSTVWLGHDHQFGTAGPPLIFETMCFGDGALDLTCRRYSTEGQAVEGHAEMVTVVRASMTDPSVVDVDLADLRAQFQANGGSLSRAFNQVGVTGDQPPSPANGSTCGP